MAGSSPASAMARDSPCDLRLVAERPAMPQQDDVIGLTSSPGMRRNAASPSGNAPNALLVAMAMDMRHAGLRLQRQVCACRARNSPNSSARSASARDSAPGSRVVNSSPQRQQAGRFQPHHEPIPARAASMRFASALARSTIPAAR